jgi:hypothetical protein
LGEEKKISAIPIPPKKDISFDDFSLPIKEDSVLSTGDNLDLKQVLKNTTLENKIDKIKENRKHFSLENSKLTEEDKKIDERIKR